MSRESVPSELTDDHTPRCLRCLNTACDRITYTGDHRGPKPIKWLNCRRTLHRVQCTNSTDLEWGGCPPQWSGSPRTQRGSAQVQGLLRKGFPGLWTDQQPHGAHTNKPKCATHICATVQDSNSVIWASARNCWLHAGKGGHPAL